MEQFSKNLDPITNPEDANYSLPVIVTSVVDKNGKQLFLRASGTSDGVTPVTENSVFWLASQSKLLTSVAALQIVERGLIGLDDDVSSVLPDLAALEILDGKDSDGKPKTRKRTEKITLRLLLSHQSGVSYDNMLPELGEYLNSVGVTNTTLDNTQIAMKSCPLIAEPRSSLNYGAGIDWAGELVSRLSKTNLENYMKQNIWEPLGMSSTTYRPDDKPDIYNRLVKTFLRQEDGTIVPLPQPVVPIPTPEIVPGHGLYSTPADYTKLLATLLAGGGSILKAESVQKIFQPQLLNKNAIRSWIEGPLKPVLTPSIPPSSHIDHGLAGILAMDDLGDGLRPKGTLQWSGMPNLIWWIDPLTGIAATAFQQILPVGDVKAGAVNIEFEKAVYEEFGKH